MNDREIEPLIRRARDGETAALEQLLVTYYEPLHTHVARRMPKERAAPFCAEDAVQEALLQAFTQVHRLREPTPRVFLAWLKALGDMSLAKYFRREGRQKRGGHVNKLDAWLGHATGSVLNLLDELPGDAKTASSLLARTETISALRVALAALPEDQRRAVQLHVLEEMTIDETAARMGRTRGSVRGLVQRAKKSIAKSLGRASVWLREK